MGGYGSGRWQYHWPRATAEGSMSLDVRKLARDHGLRPGVYTHRWTRNGNPIGWIGLTIGPDDPNAVILEYTITPRSGEPRQIRDVVPIVYTDCTYGGSRPWFLCKRCHTRRAVLYLAGDYFRCRRCGNLAYGSTRETPGQRAATRIRQLKRRLGEPYPAPFSAPPPKPKGMHWRTYDRLVHEIEWREDEQEAELDLAFARLSQISYLLGERFGAYFRQDDDDPAPEPKPGPRGEVFESFCDATIDDALVMREG